MGTRREEGAGGRREAEGLWAGAGEVNAEAGWETGDLGPIPAPGRKGVSGRTHRHRYIQRG